MPPSDGPTTLYRAYDAGGQLLYIGIATNWARRWNQHADRSPWFPAVARVELEQHDTRAAARDAERIACRDEKPLHNIEHTDRDTRPARRPSDVARYFVRSFDHAHLASIPEYQALAQAVDQAAARLGAGDLVLTQFGLESVLVELARTVAYGDCCPGCRDLDQVCTPIRGDVDGGTITTSHRCSEGHVWATTWSIDAPEYV